jgi:hypothetical protein
LLLFLPQAIAVALPIAAAIAVFFVCRRLLVTRQVCMTVGAFTVAAALVTAALNVSVAPVTNEWKPELWSVFTFVQTFPSHAAAGCRAVSTIVKPGEPQEPSCGA